MILINRHFVSLPKQFKRSESIFFLLSLDSLTKGRPSDGFFLNVEDLIRQAIRSFDYPECTIFKQLVQTIAPVEKVGR